MLLEHILNDADVLLLQLLVHGGQAGEIPLGKLVHAKAAAGGIGLDHDGVAAGHKVLKFFLGGLAKVQPLAADVLAKGGVELAFVVEEVVVLPVV